MFKRKAAVSLLFLPCLLLVSCDNEPTRPIERSLFDRYVALGNSITSGFESGGINDSTQAHSYPVLLASRVPAIFDYVEIQRPGCPAPLVGPIALTQERVGGAGANECAGVEQTRIPVVIQNLALPGLEIADVVSVPTGEFADLYQQVFGERSLLDVALGTDPSLISVWIGNNDVLPAVTSGEPLQAGRITPLARFEENLDTIFSGIGNLTRLRDAVFISVLDPQWAPVVQPGGYFWLIKQDPTLGTLLPNVVNNNCAPFLPGGARNPLANNLVSLRGLDEGREISCANDAPFVLNAEEQQLINERVAEFNRAIERRTNARGWLFVDVNALLTDELRANTDLLRKCQGLDAATTPQQYRDAALSTCPHPGAPNFFGSLVSFDAVHPSGEGHRLIADVIEAELRARHGEFR